jgi:spore coat protein U-like protein
MNHKKLAALLLLALCIPAHAAVTCSVTTNSVAFGAFPAPNPSNVDSIGSISVTCSGDPNSGASPAVTLSQGNGGAFNPRTMANGTYNLNYNLYSDSTYTTIWGDGTSGTGTVSGTINAWPTGGNGSTNFTVYGRIPANQNLVPGTYNDVITVTVTY